MLLKEGDVILVAHRRLFENDEPRFFVARVDDYEHGVVKVTGRSYVRDEISGRMIEKTERRTKILSLASEGLIVYQIPSAVALDTLNFIDDKGCLVLTDGKAFTMNLSEHTHDGRS